MPDEHLRMDLADLLSQEGELLDISCFLLLKMHGTVETTLSVPVERNAQIFIKRINRRQVHNNYFQHYFSLNQFNVQCASIYILFFNASIIIILRFLFKIELSIQKLHFKQY